MTTDSPDDWPAGYTVSFLGTGGIPLGLGMVVGPRHIVTCASVVNRALARLNQNDWPRADLTIAFPRIDRGGPEAPRRTTRVVRWSPVTGDTGADLAGLELVDGDLPDGAGVGTLRTDPPASGTARVFGYPPASGAVADLVVGERVGGGRIQVTRQTPEPPRLGPGFGGTPAYDPATGAVVGLLVPPDADGRDRLLYLVAGAEIRRFWPEVFGPSPAPGGIGLLHLSDLHFGEQREDTSRLVVEIDRQVGLSGIHPRLIVVSGDLTATGDRLAFENAVTWLSTLARNLGIPPGNVVTVPGERDVGEGLRDLDHRLARFLEPSARPGIWRPFTEAMDRLYRQRGRPGFDKDRPWSLFTFPDLRVAVAGFNSAMALSRRHEDEYGLLTGAQIEDLAERMRPYRDEGWLRLGVVHHSPAGADRPEHRLDDARDLSAALDDELISLILHGHATDGRPGQLESGPLLLGAGGTDHRFQLIGIGAGELSWHGWFLGAPGGSGRRTWLADTVRTVRHDFRTKPAPEPALRPDATRLLQRVRQATRLRNPGAFPEGWGAESDFWVNADDAPVRWAAVRAVGNTVTRATIEDFADRVRAAAPGARAALVHTGPPISSELRARARARNVDLLTLAEYQQVADLSGVVRRQADRLASHVVHVAAHYVAQGFHLREPAERPAQSDDLAAEIVAWLAADQPPVVVVTGEPGSGKSALLHRLARQLPPESNPLLLDLRMAGGGAESIDWLLFRHLFEHGLTDLKLDRIRYMVEEGRIVLLVDGVEDAPEAMRASLAGWLTPLSRIVLAVRDPGADPLPAGSRRTAELEEFTADRVEQYLVARFPESARTRTALLEENDQLRPLSRNPRMLVLLAALDESTLRSQGLTSGGVGRTAVYPRLVDAWAGRGERRQMLTSRALAIARAPASAPGDSAPFPDDSIVDWLVAEAVAAALRDGNGNAVLRSLRLTPLACEFLVELDTAGAEGWATGPAAVEDETTRRNAVDIRERAAQIRQEGSVPPPVTSGTADLRGRDLCKVDLRNLTLTGADLREANLSGLTLRDVDLSGARLQNARLHGVRMLGGSIAGAELAGSDWSGAALARVAGAPHQAPELSSAVIAERDPGRIEGVVGGMVHCLAFGPGDHMLAAGRGDVVEIVDLTGPSPRTIRYLSGHSSSVRGVAFLGDERVVSAAEDGTMRIWQITTDEEPIVVPAHTQPATTLAVSPDADIIVTGSVDHTAQLWRPDGRRHERYRQLRHGLSEITAVAIAPDRSIVITAATDRTAIGWDLISGKEQFRLRHRDGVASVSYSPDGSLIATAAGDGEAVLWHADGTEIGPLPVNGALTCVAFSPDGEVVAVGARDGSVWLCLVKSRKLQVRLRAHADEVTTVAFLAETPHVATAGKDGVIRTWHRDTGRSVRRLDSHTYWVSGLAFDPRPEGLRLAASTWDGRIMIWNLWDGTTAPLLGGDVGALNGVARSPDGTLIAAGQLLDPPVAYLWELPGGTRREPLAGHADGLTDVAFSPDGRWLATVSEDRSFAIWDPDGALRHRRVLGREAVAALAFRPLSPEFPETVLAVGHGQAVRFWNPATGEPASDLNLRHKKALNAVAFLHSGRRLVTASGGRFATAQIWNLTTPGEPPVDLNGHNGRVNCVAVHPDDSIVVTGSSDNRVRVFETRNGNLVPGPEQPHLGGVTAVAFSPDGNLLATAARDNTVRVWSSANWQRVATLHVLRDGATIAIRGENGPYRISGNPADGVWWASGRHRFRLEDVAEPRPLTDAEPLIVAPGT